MENIFFNNKEIKIGTIFYAKMKSSRPYLDFKIIKLIVTSIDLQNNTLSVEYDCSNRLLKFNVNKKGNISFPHFLYRISDKYRCYNDIYYDIKVDSNSSRIKYNEFIEHKRKSKIKYKEKLKQMKVEAFEKLSTLSTERILKFFKKKKASHYHSDDYNSRDNVFLGSIDDVPMKFDWIKEFLNKREHVQK